MGLLGGSATHAYRIFSKLLILLNVNVLIYRRKIVTFPTSQSYPKTSIRKSKEPSPVINPARHLVCLFSPSEVSSCAFRSLLYSFPSFLLCQPILRHRILFLCRENVDALWVWGHGVKNKLPIITGSKCVCETIYSCWNGGQS